MLPRTLNSVSVEVVEVLSDTEMRIKKEFPKKATESLKSKPDGTSYKVRRKALFLSLFLPHEA